jgi:amidohydrolase
MSVSFKELQKKAEEYHKWMIEVRRHLHRNPEVSFQENDTTEFVIGKLKELGIPTERPLKTGCVGIIEGKAKGKGNGRAIALRADIDALAMQEEGDHKKEFISQRPGAAHCCGHDAHTANLLGTARILMDYADKIEGKILLVFSPVKKIYRSQHANRRRGIAGIKTGVTVPRCRLARIDCDADAGTAFPLPA